MENIFLIKLASTDWLDCTANLFDNLVALEKITSLTLSFLKPKELSMVQTLECLYSLVSRTDIREGKINLS